MTTLETNVNQMINCEITYLKEQIASGLTRMTVHTDERPCPDIFVQRENPGKLMVSTAEKLFFKYFTHELLSLLKDHVEEIENAEFGDIKSLSAFAERLCQVAKTHEKHAVVALITIAMADHRLNIHNKMLACFKKNLKETTYSVTAYMAFTWLLVNFLDAFGRHMANVLLFDKRQSLPLSALMMHLHLMLDQTTIEVRKVFSDLHEYVSTNVAEYKALQKEKKAQRELAKKEKSEAEATVEASEEKSAEAEQPDLQSQIAIEEAAEAKAAEKKRLAAERRKAKRQSKKAELSSTEVAKKTLAAKKKGAKKPAKRTKKPAKATEEAVVSKAADKPIMLQLSEDEEDVVAKSTPSPAPEEEEKKEEEKMPVAYKTARDCNSSDEESYAPRSYSETSQPVKDEPYGTDDMADDEYNDYVKKGDYAKTGKDEEDNGDEYDEEDVDYDFTDGDY